MTRLTHRNIHADFTMMESDMTGFGYVQFTHAQMLGFMSENNFESEYEQDAVREWVKKQLNEDGDYDGFDEGFESSNSDFQIVMFDWMQQQDEEFFIDYKAQHRFWFYHDCCHAVKDVISASIYVDASIESDRVMEGLQYMAEHTEYNFNFDDWDLLREIEEGMMKRWRFEFDMEQALKIIDQYDEYYGYDEIKDNIEYKEREEIIELLESVGVACYDDETDELLQEALFEQVRDGNLDI